MFASLSALLSWQAILSITILISLILIIKRFLTPQTVPTHLHYKTSQLNEAIIKNCPRLSQSFTTPGWATNTHIQTILSSFILPKPVDYQREIVTLSDGGILALDWALGGNIQNIKSRPVLVVLPGLTGDRQSVSSLTKLAVDNGYRTVVFNKRGYGNTALLTPKLQSFGDPTDLKQAMEHIRRSFPDSPIAACGISAGSALLAKYLSHYGEDSDMKAAVLNSPGYKAEVFLGKTVPQPYHFIMVRNLKSVVLRHSDMLSRRADMALVKKASTLGDLETNLFSHLYGYTDMEAYKKKNDPLADLDNMATPGLCINSLDDPVCVKGNIPWYAFKEHDKCMLLTTDRGGHCGFLTHPHLTSWADQVAIDYITTVLSLI